ncbi:deoxynucleotide monophosphate kinase family protein [Rubrivivax gelatinosus]|uniref:Dephospho-CoA kinase n=1 Tax=Rubrivivax gelatinosus TaxID=28068 RepID=A0A4R2MFQ4_RUBGE|nr:hypothetical protein [Rubrivivax gelatinosus]MBK1686226.1 hypothetical protein [Rubrivivax gelatinosus]TCP05722.1 hypothetical protein EV684_101596 [Rubrivivax gelatinosus]
MNHPTTIGVDLAAGPDVAAFIHWPPAQTPLPAILGLCGLPGAGKDAAAEVLQRHGWRRIAFADALRREISEAWGVDVRLLQDRGTKGVPLGALAICRCAEPAFIGWARREGLDLAAPRSPRWLMQRYATEFTRDRDPDYWVRQVREWLLQQLGAGAMRLVITDVRFGNEAEMVRALGGRLVRLHRREVEVLTPDTADHASNALERLQPEEHLSNDGSLQALADGVEQLVRQLFGNAALGGAR